MSNRVWAEVLKAKVRDEDKPMKLRDVSSLIKNGYGFTEGYSKCRRALIKAQSIVYGSDKDSYSQLNWYIRAARELNPGSHFVLEVDESSRVFKRLFVAWGSCIEGYLHVRPMISLDGTFLTGSYNGCLLSATATTGNEELFPIAYAIVDVENNDNWIWFLQHLRAIVDYEQRPITFLSDRGSGLLNGVPIVFPGASHFYCLFHLAENLKRRLGAGTHKGYRNMMVKLFHDCAYAATIPKFNAAKEEFNKHAGDAAKEFLAGLDVYHWTNAYNVGSRYGETTSNAVESFNARIKGMKKFPITQLVDKIRALLMGWIEERSTNSAAWPGVYTREIEKRMHACITEGRRWFINAASHSVFEVLSEHTETVNFETRECSCRMWQLDGFPCSHVIAVICSKGMDIDEYVERYWFAETYRQSYAIPIFPIATSLRDSYSSEDDLIIKPPDVKRQPGRPPTERHKSTVEKETKKQKQCSECKLFGHNKRTCYSRRPVAS